MEKLAKGKKEIDLFKKNCIATGRLDGFKLDDAGAMMIGRDLRKHYGSNDSPDIIIIDPIANVFYGKKDDDDENSNSAMIAFCKRAKGLASKFAPNAAIVFLHHIAKMPKKLVDEDPFNAFRGASALRGFYDTGILLTEGNERRDRNIYFETRHGDIESKSARFEQDCSWTEVSSMQQEMISGEKQHSLQKETDRKVEYLVKKLFTESKENGRVYTLDSFCNVFSDRHGFGSSSTIKKTVESLLAKGTIKYTNNIASNGSSKLKKHGMFLVVKDMVYNGEKVDPTHHIDLCTGVVCHIENNDKKWEIVE